MFREEEDDKHDNAITLPNLVMSTGVTTHACSTINLQLIKICTAYGNVISMQAYHYAGEVNSLLIKISRHP